MTQRDQFTDCLDDETLAVVADGTVDSATRAAALVHLANCARCRMVVASLARALADPGVSRAVTAIEQPLWRRISRVAIPAAAAAVLVLLAWPPPVPENGPPHRAPVITAAPAPVLIAPVGAVLPPRVLQWSPAASADRYRVTLFDSDGRVLYETEVADTVASLPDSVSFVPRSQYLWKVDARVGWDRWAASSLAEFTVAPARR